MLTQDWEQSVELSSKNPVLFTSKCDEPKGIIERSVRLLEFTVPNLYRFWNEARRYPVLFGQKVSDDFGKFCEIFMYYNAKGEIEGRGLVWVVDDFTGVFFMTDIYEPDDATVHFSFFDGRIRGRVPIVRDIIKHVFTTYSFNRLSALVPAYIIPATFKMIEDAGFHLEGRKRRCCPYKDDIFDGYMYGILQEEVIGNNPNPYPKNTLNIKSPTHIDHARNRKKVSDTVTPE